MSDDDFPNSLSQPPRVGLVAALKLAWRPKPIAKPEIDADLSEFSVLERVAEVLRYTILVVEYALSPGGGVRAWIKLNLIVSILLAVPALLVFPIITWFLYSFTTWTGYLVSIAINLLYFFVVVAATIAVIMATHFAVKAYLKHHARSRRESKR